MSLSCIIIVNFSTTWTIDQEPISYICTSRSRTKKGRHTKGRNEGGGEGIEGWLKVKSKKNAKKLEIQQQWLNDDKFSENLKVPHKDEKEGKEGGSRKKVVVELK